MTAFSPDVPPIPRSGPDAMLARFLPSALRRTPPVAKLWPLPRILGLGFATCGFVPCVALQSRLSRLLMMHSQQCELAAESLAAHVPADEAILLTDAGAAVRVSTGLLVVSRIAVALGFALMVAWLFQHGVSSSSLGQLWLRPVLRADRTLVSGVSLLCVAYLLQVLLMNRQLVAMQQFALAFNAVVGERTGPVELPPLVWGLRPTYLLPGVVLAGFGLVWALPMVIAWAAFRSFVTQAACGFRVQLAERIQNLTGVESVVPRADLCDNADCRCGLPADAQFCPRCGRAIAGRGL